MLFRLFFARNNGTDRVLTFLDHSSIQDMSMVYNRATNGHLYHLCSKTNLSDLKGPKPHLLSWKDSENPGAFYLPEFKDTLYLLLILFLLSVLAPRQLKVEVATLVAADAPTLLHPWLFMLIRLCLKSPFPHYHWRLVPATTDSDLSALLLTLPKEFR